MADRPTIRFSPFIPDFLNRDTDISFAFVCTYVCALLPLLPPPLLLLTRVARELTFLSPQWVEHGRASRRELVNDDHDDAPREIYSTKVGERVKQGGEARWRPLMVRWCSNTFNGIWIGKQVCADGKGGLIPKGGRVESLNVSIRRSTKRSLNKWGVSNSIYFKWLVKIWTSIGRC